MYMQALRMTPHGEFLSFPVQQIFCITGLLYTGPLHIVPTRGKEEVVELGWTNPKARAEAQQIVTTRLLYCLHHPVS